jgi:hypothetical protein
MEGFGSGSGSGSGRPKNLRIRIHNTAKYASNHGDFHSETAYRKVRKIKPENVYDIYSTSVYFSASNIGVHNVEIDQ